jgi:Protein kinase domain
LSLTSIQKRHSLLIDLPSRNDLRIPEVKLSMKRDYNIPETVVDMQPSEQDYEPNRRKLVDRPRSHYLDESEVVSLEYSKSLDYVTVPAIDQNGDVIQTKRSVPLIPFDELMLIETIGTGRVSTIYRAAWQRQGQHIFSQDLVKMVALKVAMKNVENGDTSHIDELRQEADIAARLKHTCICDLVGIAADAECFCLAYEYCQGGSLLSLLTDTKRYYEYLPIALDIANGMAYLHSRNVIHRDLKPSNILLTKHHRAKIADFGMSVNNHGQELTAETGTYRYMAPYVCSF